MDVSSHGWMIANEMDCKFGICLDVASSYRAHEHSPHKAIPRKSVLLRKNSKGVLTANTFYRLPKHALYP